MTIRLSGPEQQILSGFHLWGLDGAGTGAIVNEKKAAHAEIMDRLRPLKATLEEARAALAKAKMNATAEAEKELVSEKTSANLMARERR